MRERSKLASLALFAALILMGCGSDPDIEPEPILRVGEEPARVNSRRVDVVTSSVEAEGTLRLSLARWAEDAPVALFLIRAEQGELSFMELRAADKVLLGQVDGDDDEVTYEVALLAVYDTQAGESFAIEPPVALRLAAFQSRGPGSSSLAIGPPFTVN